MSQTEPARGEPFGRRVTTVVIAHITGSGHGELEFPEEFPVTAEPGTGSPDDPVLAFTAEVEATDGSTLRLDIKVREAGILSTITVNGVLTTGGVQEFWQGMLHQTSGGMIEPLFLERVDPALHA